MNWYEDSVYIKMCEKATKIQASHRNKYGCQLWSIGDYLWSPKMETFAMVSHFEDGYTIGIDLFTKHRYEFDHHEAEYGIWLPNQSQLQGMVGNFPDNLEAFAEWAGGQSVNWSLEEQYPYELNQKATSMEQLWLAFVMYEKYGERWDSEKEEWANED